MILFDIYQQITKIIVIIYLDFGGLPRLFFGDCFSFSPISVNLCHVLFAAMYNGFNEFPISVNLSAVYLLSLKKANKQQISTKEAAASFVLIWF